MGLSLGINQLSLGGGRGTATDPAPTFSRLTPHPRTTGRADVSSVVVTRTILPMEGIFEPVRVSATSTFHGVRLEAAADYATDIPEGEAVCVAVLLREGTSGKARINIRRVDDDGNPGERAFVYNFDGTVSASNNVNIHWGAVTATVLENGSHLVIAFATAKKANEDTPVRRFELRVGADSTSADDDVILLAGQITRTSAFPGWIGGTSPGVGEDQAPFTAPAITADIGPPTLFWPGWTYATTLQATPANFAAQLDAALDTVGGATLELAAGTYNLAGWTPRLLADIRIVGIGSVTIQNNFDITAAPETGSVAVFGDFRGRVVMENITFIGWRCVIRGGRLASRCGDGGAFSSDTAGLFNTSRPAMINTMDFGLACDNLRVWDCGRFFHASSLNNEEDYGVSISNVYVFNTLISNTWQAFGAAVSKLGQNYQFYNCVFDRCVMPADPDETWTAHNAGVWLCFDQALTTHGTPDGGDIYFDHCTWHEIGSLVTGGGDTEVQCLRVTGATGPVRVRYSTAKNINVRADGTYIHKKTENSDLFYLKGVDFAVENTVIETVAPAIESMLSVKGRLATVGVTETSAMALRNVVISDVRTTPTTEANAPSSDFDNNISGGQIHATGILGANQFTNLLLDNVLVKNTASRYGLLGTASSGQPGWIGAASIANVTVQDVSFLDSDAPVQLRAVSTTDASVAFDNLLAVETGTPAMTAVIEERLSIGDPMTITATRISASFASDQDNPVSLVTKNVTAIAHVMSTAPTGTITNPGTGAAQAASGAAWNSGTPTALAAGGPEATGYSAAWLSTAPRRGSTLAAGPMLPSETP
jgi:hypothetical protein